MPRPHEKPRSGWLSQSFKAACLIAVGAAGHMVWAATGITLGGGGDGKPPYDTVLAEKARAQVEETAFAMREQARAVCTADDTDLAVLRGVKLVFDNTAGADNIDNLLLRADRDYNAYGGGFRPIHTYTPYLDHRTDRESYSGSAADTAQALDSLAALRAAGVPVLGYMLKDGMAQDHVPALLERRADGTAYLALGFRRETHNRVHGVYDDALLDKEGFALVMATVKAGTTGRFAVYKNPFTVNGAGWRVEDVGDAAAVERVKGHKDTALKMPEGICLK